MKCFKRIFRKNVVYILCGSILFNGPMVMNAQAEDMSIEENTWDIEYSEDSNEAYIAEEIDDGFGTNDTSVSSVADSNVSDNVESGDSESDNSAPDNVELGDSESDNSTPDNVESGDSESGDSASDNSESGDSASDNVESDDSVSDDSVSDNSALGDSVSDNSVSDNSVSDNSVSDNEVVIPTSMSATINVDYESGNSYRPGNLFNEIYAECDMRIIIENFSISPEYLNTASGRLALVVNGEEKEYECRFENDRFVFDTASSEEKIYSLVIVGFVVENVNGERVEADVNGFVLGMIIYFERAAQDAGLELGTFYINHDISWDDIKAYKPGVSSYRICQIDNIIATNEGNISYDRSDINSFSINTPENTVETYSIRFRYGFHFWGNMNYNDITFVVDKKDPEISIKYFDSHGNEISDYNKIYNEDITVKFTVDDDYICDFSFYNVLDKGNPLNGDSGYDGDSNEVTFEYVITTDGEYSFGACGKDRAGNYSEIQSGTICIDKTNPIVSLAFDDSVAKNDIYYNKTRTATITITEKNFDINKCSLLVDTVYGTSVELSDWTQFDSTYTCKVIFSKDDEYSGYFFCTDLAGNKSNEVVFDKFIIDTTAPSVDIYYNDYNAKNTYYYSEGRVAHVTVEDVHFIPEMVKIENESTHGISISKWEQDVENKYISSVECTKDGEYKFYVTAEDLAGNVSSKAYSGLFVVDTVAPTIEIIGVADRSANASNVIPQVRCRDENIYGHNTVVNVNGFKNGLVSPSSSVVDDDAMNITYDVFTWQKASDDIYTVVAHAEDKAGNTSDLTYMFSVNRFGSTFGLSLDTTSMIDKYYINGEHDVVLMETNVDDVEQQSLYITKDGQSVALVAGVDYTAVREGTDETWKAYTYTISKDYFCEDGKYEVILYTEDKAGNHADNNSQGMNVEFVVDKTAPSIVVSRLDSNTRYEVDEVSINIDVQDNTVLDYAQIIVNGKVVKTVLGDDLDEVMTLTLEKADSAYSVVVRAADVAGNIAEKSYHSVLVGETLVGENAASDNSVIISDDNVPLASTTNGHEESEVDNVVTSEAYNISNSLRESIDNNQTKKADDFFGIIVGIIGIAFIGGLVAIIFRRKQK